MEIRCVILALADIRDASDVSLNLKTIFVGISFLLLALPACNEDATAPPPIAESKYGLTGIVVDSSGARLDSVAVYCLFHSSFIPPENAGHSLTRVSDADTFDFELYQNFPNPFSHSTFIRFSLPSEIGVRLSIVDRFEGIAKDVYVDNLPLGLYQLYLSRIVDSLNLRNGPHTFLLEATTSGGVYTLTSEAFVISDSGLPAAATNASGTYVFEYNQAFVGDSVLLTSTGDDIYQFYLTNSVYLLFQRGGYRPETIESEIFQDLLLQRDVVLFKEEQP